MEENEIYTAITYVIAVLAGWLTKWLQELLNKKKTNKQ